LAGCFLAAAVLEARRRVRRGGDKRSSRSKPHMDISSPRLDFLLEKIETEPRLVLKFWEMENGKVRRTSLRSTREIQTR
jgi:hypothetical protein